MSDTAVEIDSWGNDLLPQIPDDPEDSAPVPAGTYPATWRLLNDVELMSLPDPEYLVADLLPRRGVGSAYGPSGTGKTTLVAQLLTAVATGRPFFGHRVCHPGACVYVATEDPAGFKVRLRSSKVAAGLSLAQPIGVYTFPEPIDLRDRVSVSQFVNFLEQVQLSQPLELIVLDTYAASMPGASETSSEDTTIAMAHAAWWRDALQATVLMVHHTNASGSRERGHSAMRGACDFMISLTSVDDAIHVESSKQRNGPPFAPFTLKLVPLPDGGCVLRAAKDVITGKGLTQQQQKALDVLRESFTAEAGATKSEWQRSCQDVPERTFHRVTKLLVERGHVRQVGSHYRLVDGLK